MLCERRSDTGVQFLSPGAQQGAVGSVLHQRMLEQVGRSRRDAAAEQQPGFAEPVEPSPQLAGWALRHQLDQVVAELAANDCADLPDLLGDRPEPVEACNQGGMKGSRDSEL